MIGNARQLEVFPLTGILLLGVLRQDILQSELIISHSDDSVNARANNVVVKELLCGFILLTNPSKVNEAFLYMP